MNNRNAARLAATIALAAMDVVNQSTDNEFDVAQERISLPEMPWDVTLGYAWVSEEAEQPRFWYQVHSETANPSEEWLDLLQIGIEAAIGSTWNLEPIERR